MGEKHPRTKFLATTLTLLLGLLLKERLDLLDHIPQVSGVLQHQHPVLGCNFVEPCALLVAEKCVRSPDGIPGVVLQTHFGLLLSKFVRIERQSLVCPILAKIHAHRIVLHNDDNNDNNNSSNINRSE